MASRGKRRSFYGVDDEVWRQFRAQAALRGMNQKDYFTVLVERASRNEEYSNELEQYVEGVDGGGDGRPT